MNDEEELGPVPDAVDALWDHAENHCKKCQPIAAIGARHGVVFVNPNCKAAKILAANMILEAETLGRLNHDPDNK